MTTLGGRCPCGYRSRAACPHCGRPVCTSCRARISLAGVRLWGHPRCAREVRQERKAARMVPAVPVPPAGFQGKRALFAAEFDA